MIRLIPRAASRSRNIRHVSFSVPVRATEVSATRVAEDIVGREEDEPALSAEALQSFQTTYPKTGRKERWESIQAAVNKRALNKDVEQAPIEGAANRHLQRVELLRQWQWFEYWHPGSHPELAERLGNNKYKDQSTSIANSSLRKYCEPEYREFIDKQYNLAHSFRKARARLWRPLNVTVEHSQKRLAEMENQLRKALQERRSERMVLKEDSSGREKALVTELQRRYEEAKNSLKEFCKQSHQNREDTILKEHWVKLSNREREDELLRVRYECIGRLGWRKGYTSGFPMQQRVGSLEGTEEVEGAKESIATKDSEAITNSSTTERLEMLANLGSDKESERKSALKRLAEAEEAAARKAWYEMNNATRAEEEKAAWDLRDRSLIYIDETARILNKAEPQWFENPQKVGSMIFLPNVIVRLVRNTVRKGDTYDAFKATFRVPLSMHKHALRSYLLAIYGLRTTWCRSAIYRAAIKRTRFGQKKIGPSNRTFKKVEVGLLEPFLFPEITPSFREAHMNAGEMTLMAARSKFKLSGKRGWRGAKPLMPPRDGGKPGILEDDGSTTVFDGNMVYRQPKRRTDLAMEQPAKDGQSEVKTKPWVSNSFRVASLPAKRKSTILRLVYKERLKKEAEIASKMVELQKQHKSEQDQRA